MIKGYNSMFLHRVFLFMFASLRVLFSLISPENFYFWGFFCLFLKIIFLLKLNTTLSYIILLLFLKK